MEEKKENIIYVEDGQVFEVSPITGEVIGKSASLENYAENEKLPIAEEEVNKFRIFKYNRVYGEFICQKLAEGMSLSSICNMPGMPSFAVIARWKFEEPAFAESMRIARSMRAEIAHDEIWEDRDADYTKDEVPSAKLKFEKRKYLAEMNDPETYGKKKEITEGGGVINITIDTGINRDNPVILEGEYERKGEIRESISEDDGEIGTDGEDEC